MDITAFQNTQYSDEALCALAAGGDRGAEEALVLRYHRVVRICARPFFLAGGDSEDLIQEAMFGLLKAIREFDPGRDAAFRTFAEVCIRNRILTVVSAAGREKHAPLNNSVSMEEEAGLPDRAFGPEDTLILREEQVERLQRLRTKLSPLERKVLSLYLEGYSYEEIAARVGRSVKSVDNAVQRIRRKVG